MTSGVQLGAALALVCAVMTNLAALLKHRGAQSAPPVTLLRPLATARALAASRWFAAGMGLAAFAWLFHLAALALAPISLVQAMLASGAVLLAVMADRLFGHTVSARQWAGLALGALGLALLVITVPRLGSSYSSYSGTAMPAFEGGLILLAGALVLARRSSWGAGHAGALLGAGAGALFAFAGIAIKAMTGADGPEGVLLSPWFLPALGAGILAQYAAVRGLQVGEAVAVIALTGLVANLAQIAGGVLVFGDPLAGSAPGIVLQAVAFCCVCAAAFLMPARVGAVARPA